MNERFFRIFKKLLGILIRPTLTGASNLPQDPAGIVYVLYHQSVTDLAMLDLGASAAGLVSPSAPYTSDQGTLAKRYLNLFQARQGRLSLSEHSRELAGLMDLPADIRQTITLVPVSVFWGRAMSAKKKQVRLFSAARRALSGPLKRLFNVFINRKNIFVHTGKPIHLHQLILENESKNRSSRRIARVLRVQFRQQKEIAAGPDKSPRTQLIEQLINTSAVQSAIQKAAVEDKDTNKHRALALKYADTIAADMSHPTARVFATALRWFWNKIYAGIEVDGLDQLEDLGKTHCLVYVPSHRSHLDYLLLSYLLYYRGFVIPHIVAGDNLNLPLVGPVLRRCGAMFMRRSFRDNPLYSAVFEEYLYQVYYRGHCVEFFPEGGRTRTGRLLQARLGLLKMSLAHHQRGLPKPLAFVPVYFGYEKLIEGASYLKELRGAEKTGESISDIFRNLKLIRQNFGAVRVNVGTPIKLDQWLAKQNELSHDDILPKLSYDIMASINAQASVNAVNLVALITLTTPKIAIEQYQLEQQIACYQQLLRQIYPSRSTFICADRPPDIIAHVEMLGLLSREGETFGAVLSHSPFTSVLMTWYRNNVLHLMALPSLIACLVVNRRRGLEAAQLKTKLRLIYPWLARELSTSTQHPYFEQCLHAMVDQGLLILKQDQYFPPAGTDARHTQLILLGNLVSQTLERMFIVIHKLTVGPITRDKLLNSSQLLAQKMARLHGINAPEFSDKRLFNLFVDGLIDQGLVKAGKDEKLTYDPLFDRVLRAAEYVIDPQIRQAVIAANQQT